MNGKIELYYVINFEKVFIFSIIYNEIFRFFRSYIIVRESFLHKNKRGFYQGVLMIYHSKLLITQTTAFRKVHTSSLPWCEAHHMLDKHLATNYFLIPEFNINMKLIIRPHFLFNSILLSPQGAHFKITTVRSTLYA